MSCRSRSLSSGFVSMKTFNDTKDDLDYQSSGSRSSSRASPQTESAAVEPAVAAARCLDARSTAAWALPAATSASSASARRSPASSAGSTSSSANRCSRASASARSTAPAATSCRPTSTNIISDGCTSGRPRPPTVDGKTYRLKVAKVYPQVRNGQFQIDLVFDGAGRRSVQRGQTIQTKLTLGDSSKAVLIPNGAFFNDTGGNWVFVVDNERQRRDQAPGSARPPQRRFHRSARAGSRPASA